jgi:hypothetical protein
MVARKARVPRAAIIASILLGSAKPDRNLFCSGRALKALVLRG